MNRRSAQAAPTATVTLKHLDCPLRAWRAQRQPAKVKKWSDYIDYWAVDWNFHSDVFAPDWVTYRSRRERTLALTSEPHVYDKPGSYRMLIKLIDIFGNEASQEVKINL